MLKIIHNRTLVVLLFILFSVVAVLFVPFDPVIWLIISACLLAGILLCIYPMAGFCLMILVLPLLGTDFMDMQLVGIPGIKISNLLMVAVLCLFMLNKKRYAITGGWNSFFLTGIMLFFMAAVVLSTRYMPRFTYWFWSEEYNTLKYFLSHWLRPVLFVIPFFILLAYIRTEKELDRTFQYLIGSMLILSLVILYLYIFMVPNKEAFHVVRFIIGSHLGMHGNNISDFYIIGFPILLMAALEKKKLFYIATLVLSLVAVAVLYSRAAYAVILLSAVLVFIATKKIKWIPILLICGLLFINFIPESVVKRALTGMDTMDAQDISAGRVEDIWLPIINETAGEPARLLFGSGRYGIMGTQSFEAGAVLSVGHAHNMYLDMIMDSGIMGLLFFLLLYAFYYKKASDVTANLPAPKRHMITALKISLVAFLVRGLTDSFFYPALTNAYIWVVLGLIAASGYIYLPQKMKVSIEGEANEKGGIITQHPSYWRS